MNRNWGWPTTNRMETQMYRRRQHKSSVTDIHESYADSISNRHRLQVTLPCRLNDLECLFYAALIIWCICWASFEVQWGKKKDIRWQPVHCFLSISYYQFTFISVNQLRTSLETHINFKFRKFQFLLFKFFILLIYSLFLLLIFIRLVSN